MSKIQIGFCDFWPGFSESDNFFLKLLRTRHDVELSSHPDFLIFSRFGRQHRLHTCPRIFYSGESELPNWRACDYAITSHYIDSPCHLRVPLYVLYANSEELRHLSLQRQGAWTQAPEPAEKVMARKTKFCAFLVSNTAGDARKRTEFFLRLSRYKKVDSGGRALNNIGRSIPPGLIAKQHFLRPYKFNLCFENKSVPGYTTEKIYEAMLARCIPIYWGSPRVHEEFNPKSFLNCLDFQNEETLVERIMEIDNNDSLYLEYLRQPCFHNDRPTEWFDLERLHNFFDMIFNAKIRPIGTRWKCLRRFFAAA